MIIPFARRRVPIAVALAALALGTIAAVHYHRLGLTLSHYDARGHLVVARRIVDSITPGWQQIGAVWLPLPHLLNALPVQIDLFYRTGASAVAISIVSFAIATGAIARIVLEITGSNVAAFAAAAVFALNPNVLYLQSTPMTEPLLIALTTTSIRMLVAESRGSNESGRSGGSGKSRGPGKFVGWVLAGACLTRYEAWPVTVAALALTYVTRLRAFGDTARQAYPTDSTIWAAPAVAIAAFLVFSRVVIGDWFVGSGFFVPENKSLGDLEMSLKEIAWGIATLSSTPLVWIGTAGMFVLLLGLLSRRRARTVIAVALVAMAAIPFAAFYRGHPFRVRYMVPMIAAEAIGAGVAASAVPLLKVPGAVALIVLATVTLRPFDATAPMVVEAQWDRPNVPVRAEVTACLADWRPGQKVMASMGSLGHYMQETSRAGFSLRDYLHEGNGDIWLAALETPRPFADWILIEEKAEGGDVLAHRARERSGFLDGYLRRCEGAGLALYRRK